MMKIVSAAAMLAVSASMLGTSTYAWFSLNTTVNVDNFQVSVKTSDTYLLISTSAATAGGIQTQNDTTDSVTIADAALFPSSPALTADEAAYLTTSGKKVDNTAITTAGVQVNNATKAAAVTNWFTANALDPGAPAIDTTTARQLTSWTDYVIVQHAYITVAKGANPANNLKVTPTFTQSGAGSDLAAAKVLVTTSDGGYAALSYANNGTEVDISGSNTNITDSDVVDVTFYIYYDGDEAPVYTNNMANLTGAEFEFEFNVDANP